MNSAEKFKNGTVHKEITRELFKEMGFTGVWHGDYAELFQKSSTPDELAEKIVQFHKKRGEAIYNKRFQKSVARFTRRAFGMLERKKAIHLLDMGVNPYLRI